MFKIIKTEYYDNFRCLMDKCKDNCCDENWIISIDDETYEKYKALGIENLEDKISYETKTIIKKNGKCPFILENGLCFWHKEYGEDYLSNTCKSYPRFVSSYGDVYVENIGLSCPASAEWVVNLDHKCEIIEKIYLENESENPKAYRLINAEILMRTVINIIYRNSSYISGINELYQLFESSEDYSQEENILPVYDLVFCNISICYLFEHIMLESKKETPNYVGVVNTIATIISKIIKRYIDIAGYEKNNEIMADTIYKTMREEDHII